MSDGLLVLSGSNSAATGGITVNNNASVCFDALGSINGTGQNVMIASGGLACFGMPFVGGDIPTALARINPASTGVIAVDNFGSTAFNFSTINLKDVYLGALADTTYSGTFSAYGGVYRIGGGTGTITLSGANALTGSNSLLVGGKVVISNSNNIIGATTINSTGRLQIGAGGTSGSLASSSITNNGILAFNRSDTLTQGTSFWSSISGSGVVEKAGSGELVLNTSNSYSGGTNMVAGTLRLGNSNAIGGGALTIYSGTLDVVGPEPLTLSAGNDITIGGNFILGGTANLNMGTGAASSFANSIITLGGAGKTLTFGGVMTNTTGGNQTLTVNGSGNTLVLGGYAMSGNIYATNIATTITGDGNVSITGPVLDWSDEPNFEVRFGSLTKTGPGTLTLLGNNNYTGNTVVSGGVLHLASGTQKSPIIVNNGGTLAFNLGTTITSSKKLTLNAGHKIRIFGTPSLPSYTLMTASSIVGGVPTLEPAVSGYFLEVAGNSLKLTQLDNTPPVLTSANIVDDQGGGPIPQGTLVTYTLSFNEDIDHNTVTADDFNNAGTSTITIGTISEISPGIFTVQVTPTSVGTLILRIPTTADIRGTAIPSNMLDSDPAILDDTTINVVSPYNLWAGTGPDRGFNEDLNGDGIANGLAWLLGASDPNENALILMPEADEESGALVLGFTTLKTAARGTASIKVQYSKDLGASDLWANHQAVVPDTSGTDIPSGIVFDIQPLEEDYISVLARIPASAAGTGKRLFGRVIASSPP